MFYLQMRCDFDEEMDGCHSLDGGDPEWVGILGIGNEASDLSTARKNVMEIAVNGGWARHEGKWFCPVCAKHFIAK